MQRETRADTAATMGSWLADYNGIVHELIGDQTLRFSAAMLKMKGGAYWWATAVSIWQPVFVEHMNKLIEDSSPIDELWPWFSTAGPENLTK